ncbi:MAG: hypothetical protein CG441_885 [Methylococcaceae bacterium NSM2-1]|nr:MAG: hypothetical protein CG441_885 [Methylococcaceae bacterium NSM2-1]
MSIVSNGFLQFASIIMSGYNISTLARLFKF